MLSYEALIQQAKIREMPPNKIRGILREYLQILILKEIYRKTGGKKLYFTGGTYLRLAHNIRRFSEDLDFNSEKMSGNEFEKLLESIRTELARSGFECKTRFSSRGQMYAASLIFLKIEEKYNAVTQYSKREGLVIKVETNVPGWKIKKETQVVAGFGEMFPIVSTDKGALFADKIDALTKKTRGRHLYDIIFMLSNKCPVSQRVIDALGIKDEPLTLVEERVESFSKAELKKQAEALRPFLFDEQEAGLIINAHTIIPQLISKYRKWVNTLEGK